MRDVWSFRPSSAVLAVVALLLVGSPVVHDAHAAPGDQSPDRLWTEVDPSALGTPTTRLPRAFHAYQLNLAALRAILETAPPETARRGEGAVFWLPLADGTFARVHAHGSPVFGSALAAQYPDIQTYSFIGLDDPAIAGRLTATPTTMQAIMRPPSDLARVAPIVASNGVFYLSYLNADRTDGADDFRLVHDEPRDPDPPPPPVGIAAALAGPFAGVTALQGLAALAQSGDTLRVYRLAAAATAEYYQARGNNNTDVVASIATEISNANVVFEAELTVRLEFTHVLLWDDPDTDPYTAGATACGLRDENQAAIEGTITSADYDIGFVFGTGGGNGCAWYVVCQADKARGAGLVNTANVVVGGSTGLLLHEMGHQLGARHTFSGGAGGCTALEFNPESAYEPGSGTTIASYLGNCGSDNVVTNALPPGQYYHARSFDEIITNITVGTGSTCGTTQNTGNGAPTVDAGPDYTIPRGTPFTLTGSGDDPDGDPLTFTWEQFDAADTQRSIDSANLADGPIFRSVMPIAGPSRTFPTWSDILANTQTKGEILPAVDRTLTFRLTARDNRVGGGGVGSDTAVLTVSGPPFFITSPNGGETLHTACELPVTWVVGGGSVADNVTLRYSSNGGASFATQLVASTPNDGDASSVVPCGATNQARVMAAAVDNVFFDVSNNNFSVVSVAPTVDVAANGGNVDDQCEFVVPFSAKITDDCGVGAGSVSVNLFKGGNNFDVGAPIVNAVQQNGQTVTIQGTVLVSNLTSSPAVLTIQVSAPDACGANGSDQVQVQVSDTTPPSITATVKPALLWPPKHSLEPIQATVVATDNCPGVGYVLTSITSNEPDNGTGDGDTVQDIQAAALGTPDLAFLLRAERAGNGTGRIYTIRYTASDGSGNETTAEPIVKVPHSQKP